MGGCRFRAQDAAPCVRFLAAKGLLNRTLISQDAGWYRVGEPSGGDFRGYTYLYSDFLPLLQSLQVTVLMLENRAPRSVRTALRTQAPPYRRTDESMTGLGLRTAIGKGDEARETIGSVIGRVRNPSRSNPRSL